MKYTLDSIQHVTTALEEKYKLTTSVKEPIIVPLEELQQIKASGNEDIFFFGIITYGSPINSDNTLEVMDEYDNEILTINSNNQAMLLFYNLKSDTPLKGQFRGFQIRLQGFNKKSKAPLA